MGMQEMIEELIASTHRLKGNTKETQQILYKCGKCKDRGFIIKKEDRLQDLMIECECRKVDKAKRLFSKSGLNMDQTKLTFSTFKTVNNEQLKAKKMAAEYLNSFSKIKNMRKNSIFFSGSPGVGKTHLSIAIAVNMLKLGIEVVYMTYRDSVTKIKMNMTDEAAYMKMVEMYKTCEVLLIDDLLKGKITDSDKNIMFEIINYRYIKNKAMIISSEYDIDKLLDFDEAIASRILEMSKDFTMIFTESSNYRLLGA